MHHLVEHSYIHHQPSTCASAASAWGSQKVMSMARYSAMAADSSVRACSPLADRGIQRAEAAVAVGLERAHAQLLGQGEGLMVVVFGLLDAPEARAAPQSRRGGAGHTPGCPRSWRVTGERQRALGEGVRLLQAAGQQMRLSQWETTQRLKARHVRWPWSVPSPA